MARDPGGGHPIRLGLGAVDRDNPLNRVVRSPVGLSRLRHARELCLTGRIQAESPFGDCGKTCDIIAPLPDGAVGRLLNSAAGPLSDCSTILVPRCLALPQL